MKKVMLFAALLVLSLVTASQAPAQKVEKAPQDRYPVRLLPDLVVGVDWNKEKGTADVLVRNVCKGKSAPVSLIIYVYDSKNSKTSIGSHTEKVPGIAAGGSHRLLISNGYLANRPFIRVVVDSDKKVQEASEDNNWWEPEAQPFPQKGGYCDPPYDK